MLEDLKKEYDRLVPEYNTYISKRFSREDFIRYNEILFSAHSCSIEGNSFSVDETRTLKEQGLGMIPQGKSLVEAFEMLDHFKAYEYMLSTVDEPLSEDYLKKLHFLLMEHTIGYRHEGALPGVYTDTDMCAGDTLFGEHEKLIAQVPKLLESTNSALTGNVHPMEIAALFHGFFEYLHPFRDGNGRMGRLLSNKLLLQKKLPLLIIPSSERESYIRCLKLFRKESKEYLVDFFFRTAIKRMKQEIEDKKNLSENFKFGFTGEMPRN